MPFRAAIFDMDGVVVDTVPIHFNAWKRMFADYGHDFSFEEYKQKVDGIPRTDGARAVLTGLNDEEVKKAANKKQDYFLEEIERVKIPVYQSTVDLIGEFKSCGIRVAVVSASRNAPRILTRVGLVNRLDAVVSGLDIRKGKPDPEIFLVAAKRLGAKSEECAVFEDAVLGVLAANRAHMRCVGVDRYGNPERLKNADIVVSDLGEIDYNKILKLFTERK